MQMNEIIWRCASPLAYSHDNLNQWYLLLNFALVGDV
jgi:hypothetical protein